MQFAREPQALASHRVRRDAVTHPRTMDQAYSEKQDGDKNADHRAHLARRPELLRRQKAHIVDILHAHLDVLHADYNVPLSVTVRRVHAHAAHAHTRADLDLGRQRIGQFERHGHQHGHFLGADHDLRVGLAAIDVPYDAARRDESPIP